MSDPGAEPRLVVPEGLVIDESARERLERRLAGAPASVVGVAAECVALEPGASYRVHAEWAALDAPASADVNGAGGASRSTRGAVLVRPDVAFTVREGCVEIAEGTVLVDPGARVHDPFRATGPLLPASERGRPPFPRRPVVVFLACDPPSAADADAVRRLVNRLVRRDVEARIAFPAATDPAATAGLQLTRPCLADEATIRALAPDVVVTLDATAAAVVDAWCAGNRSTVVVAFDPTLVDPMELVSWQIGHAAGRLRARIGPRVEVPAFAALVVRLCAGPHPEPPPEVPELLHVRTPVREHWNTGATADPAAGCVVLTGRLAPAERARVDGFVDSLEGAGLRVAIASLPGAVPDAARRVPLVFLAGVAGVPELRSLVDDRNRAGLPTVFDLGPADVERGDRARLTPAASELAGACGLVVAAPGARHTAARASGKRVLVVPTLLTRANAAALRAARRPIDPAAPRVIGWRLSHPDGDPALYAEAVADGIAHYLTESRDHVEVVGDATNVPASLRGHDRVSVVAHTALDVDTIAAWAVHVWTPAFTAGVALDDARVLEEASCAGVPSVLPEGACAAIDGFVSPHVQAEDPDTAAHWYDVIHHVLDDPGVRARRAEEAWRRADALDGAAASKAVVSRLMGWAAYQAVSA